jgi:hypothetical protein
MKSWKLLLAVALATVGVLLLTSIVLAAPEATDSVQSAGMYDDADPILTDTLPTTHPIGSLIALYFNIPYTQVMALHDQGFGFGNIARAYLTAYASDGVLTPEQVLAMRVAGVGWGQIKKDYGIHPGGNGLGSIKRNKPQPEPTSSAVQVKPGKKDVGSCPGNSCNAPGQQKPPKDKPSKGPKK